MKMLFIQPSPVNDRTNNVLRVLEHLSRGPLRSMANAAVTLIEQSPGYREALQEIEAGPAKARK